MGSIQQVMVQSQASHVQLYIPFKVVEELITTNQRKMVHTLLPTPHTSQLFHQNHLFILCINLLLGPNICQTLQPSNTATARQDRCPVLAFWQRKAHLPSDSRSLDLVMLQLYVKEYRASTPKKRSWNHAWWVHWAVPPPSNSHHQDYYIFGRGSQPNLHFPQLPPRSLTARP